MLVLPKLRQSCCNCLHFLTGTTEAKETKKYFALKEAIVSGGAFNTPQILMQIGIGPNDHLENHDIEVMVDVPGVGQNLQDKVESCGGRMQSAPARCL
jgi:choline dehydrogenase-like flavoprotein